MSLVTISLGSPAVGHRRGEMGNFVQNNYTCNWVYRRNRSLPERCSYSERSFGPGFINKNHNMERVKHSLNSKNWENLMY